MDGEGRSRQMSIKTGGVMRRASRRLDTDKFLIYEDRFKGVIDQERTIAVVIYSG